eukprot:SAG22_NODE_5623_length_982_cov_1.575311_3_plen_30_part_01
MKSGDIIWFPWCCHRRRVGAADSVGRPDGL